MKSNQTPKIYLFLVKDLFSAEREATCTHGSAFWPEAAGEGSQQTCAVNSWKAFHSQRPGASSGAANRTKCSPWKQKCVGNESDCSLKTIGGYPCLHSYTGSHPERMEEWCVCVRVCVCVCVNERTHPGICDLLHVSMYLLSRLFPSSTRFGPNLSTFRHSLSSLSCLPEHI